MRVQIPAYTDRWMMGDRYGEVVKTQTKPISNGTSNGFKLITVYRVKLDKSGKTVSVIADDCTEV